MLFIVSPLVLPMKKFFIVALILSVIFLPGCTVDTVSHQSRFSAQHNVLSWESVDEGMSFARLETSYSGARHNYSLMLVKIDPRRLKFDIYENADQDHAKSIRDIFQERGAKFVFNGAFFSEDFRPISLLVSEGRVLHALSTADLLNGVFVLDKKGTGELVGQEAFHMDSSIDFAIQNGPILLDKNGKNRILSDDGKLASRTAIGLDNSGHVVVILLKTSLFDSENMLSLYQFADLLQNASSLRDIGLHSVLNLDGGPSTGMMIGNLYYPEMEKVQHVIVVKESAR